MTNDYTEEQAREAIRLLWESIPLMQNAVTYGRHNGDDRYDEWLSKAGELAAAAKPIGDWSYYGGVLHKWPAPEPEPPGPWPVIIAGPDADHDEGIVFTSDAILPGPRFTGCTINTDEKSRLRDALCAELGPPKVKPLGPPEMWPVNLGGFQLHRLADNEHCRPYRYQLMQYSGNDLVKRSEVVHFRDALNADSTDEERAARIVADLKHFGAVPSAMASKLTWWNERHGGCGRSEKALRRILDLAKQGASE